MTPLLPDDDAQAHGGPVVARRGLALGALLAALAGALPGAVQSAQPTPAAVAAPAGRLLAERRMPAFRVHAPAGRALTADDFLGQWTYVLVGYTSCPDACPTALAMLTQAFEAMGGEAQRVRALFLSIDPRRDRPEVLAAYLSNFSPRITAATASPEDMAATARSFGMRFDVVGDPQSRTYTIDHTVAMLLFNPEGRFVTLVPPGATATELVADLRRRIHPRTKP